MTIVSSEVPTGKTCRVSARIIDGHVGEVIIDMRGGAEAYLARPAVHGDEFFVGDRVKVVDFQAPRTVYVELCKVQPLPKKE